MKIDKSIGRDTWIDVLKFLGIFAIYLGHLGTSSGKFYLFVYTYHVPLFFFISGFFALKNKEKTIGEYIIKKIRHIIMPYFFFSGINIVFYSVLNNSSGTDIINMIKVAMFGIRNTIVAGGGLWFFPCLFIISIFYFILNKIFKNKYVVISVILIIYIISQTCLPYEPSWFMNIDSAMYFIIYYCIGDITFKYIKNFNFKKLRCNYKLIIILISMFSIIIAGIIYLKGFSATLVFFNEKFRIFNKIPLINSVFNLIVTFNIIYFNIIIANLLKNIKLLQIIGANTLILCGTEGIIKMSLDSIVSIIGLNITISSQLSSIIYTFICLVIGYNTICRFLNMYYPRMVGKVKVIDKIIE